MRVICPKCGIELVDDAVNVEADVARCVDCDEVYRLSDLLGGGEPQEEAASLDPPAGTKVIYELRPDGGATFELPAAGFSPLLIVPLGFSAFWLAFVAFWTAGASAPLFSILFGDGEADGPPLLFAIFFPAFSIPFWAVGVGMVYSALNSIYEKQTFRFDRNGVTFIRHRIIGEKEVFIPYGDIRKIDFHASKPTSPTQIAGVLRNAQRMNRAGRANRNNAAQVLSAPTIMAGTKTYAFATQLSEAEQEWLVAVFASIYRALSPDSSDDERPLP